MLSVPSFVTICQLPETKILLQDSVNDLKDEMNIPYEKALEKVIKGRISRTNGIDLNVETSLFDLGVELISCYSALPKLILANKKPKNQVNNEKKSPALVSNSVAEEKTDSESKKEKQIDDKKVDYENMKLDKLLEFAKTNENADLYIAIAKKYDDNDDVKNTLL